MKIALDISPTLSGHKIRGIGIYTKNLKEEFEKSNYNVEFFANPKSPPKAEILHFPYFDLFFHTLPFRSKSKRVVTIHDVIPLVFPNHFPVGIKGRISLYFQKIALRNTKAIICDSETSKIDITNKLSVSPKKIHVIYLAPSKIFKKTNNDALLNLVTNKYKLPKKFILYVGDINWNKNILNLLEAVKISQVSIVMVGKALNDNSIIQTQEINEKIKKLGIEKKVIRLGFINDKELVAIYNMAQLTILPSFYEGFGLPVLESMACGTPVVCSNKASLSEIAKNTAIFCNPNDPYNISEKIKEILNLSPKEKELLSQKSVKHAAQFTWEKVVKDTIKVYESIA